MAGMIHCQLWMGSLEPYMTESFIMMAFQKMGEHPQNVKVMRNKFTGEPAGYCFVHFPTDEQAIDAMHKLNGKPIPRFSHWHVIYDCNYIQATCQCRWHRVPEISGAKHRFKRWADFSSAHLHNLGIYLNSGGRELYAGEGGNRNERLLCDVAHHSRGSDAEQINRDVQLLATCDLGYKGPGRKENRTGGLSDEMDSGGPSENYEHTQQNYNKPSKMERLQEFIINRLTVPISQIISTPYFYNSEWNWFTRSTKMFESAVQIVGRKFIHYSIRDFINLYDSITPQFMAYNGNFNGTYYSRNESYIFLKRLILYQLEDNEEGYVEFIHFLYRLLNRNNGKKNCLFIIGPANSLKTTFTQCLASFCITKGQIQNFNRNNSFPLTDCIDKRILVWDEPNFERGDLETIKLLFAGDPCIASVKYSNNVTITKTPVLCTANSNVFPQNDPFDSRIQRYYWSPPPFLTQEYKLTSEPGALRCAVHS